MIDQENFCAKDDVGVCLQCFHPFIFRLATLENVFNYCLLAIIDSDFPTVAATLQIESVLRLNVCERRIT